MGNSIITLRLKKTDLDTINRLVKSGRFHSKADALRGGIQLLRENEKETSLSGLVYLRQPKPEFTLEDIIKELDENLISEGESGDLIEASRER